MAHRRTYTYSQLSASSAGEFVEAHYDLAKPLHSKFYVLGLHDNYVIEGARGRYILRIYRNDWRSPEEVYFELELLAYLHERHAPVAWPLRTTGGELGFRIESPEGERMAALFDYAEGNAPAAGISAQQCILLGRAVADVHHKADTFVTHYRRPDLDMHHLVDESIEAIAPFLDPCGQAYIGRLHKWLRLNWPDIRALAGVFGICIGDVNTTNFHVTDEGKITLFDFDQCGFGARAFELGKFASSLHSHRMKRTLVNAFLDGYQQRRSLSRAECEAIPYFELVAHIWVLAIHAKNANRIGYQRLEQPFWDRNLAIVKELEAQQGTTSGYQPS